ncbi:hypothetical protein B566_EDAN010152 [Ephemera danica]|nr:hypothetical protein B566_EDAN010152 [Ephemera danica]
MGHKSIYAMSASVCNYIFTIMEERQRALRGLHVEEGVGVPAANSGSSVKRCLFGKPDSMEIQRKYEEIHKEEMKRQEKKWGFNFETETPTDNSRYQWERVGGPVGSDIPTPCVMPQMGSSTAHSDAASPPVEVDLKETSKPSTSPPPPQPSSSKDNGPTKQSLITDFMPQKRHATVQSDSSSKRQKMPPSPPHPVSSSPATAAGGSGAPAEEAT